MRGGEKEYRGEKELLDHGIKLATVSHKESGGLVK